MHFLLTECNGFRQFCVSGGFENDLAAVTGTVIAMYDGDLAGCWASGGLQGSCPVGYTPISLAAGYTPVTGFSDSFPCTDCWNSGAPFGANRVFTPAHCNGSDGSLTITIIGGFPPFTSYIKRISDGAIIDTFGPSFQRIHNFCCYPANSLYKLVVQDSNLGFGPDGAQFSYSPLTFTNTPEIIQVSILKTDATCSGGGTIDLTILNGTAPFTFTWIGPNGFISTSQFINNLAQGKYYLTQIVDANGCVTYPVQTYWDYNQSITATALVDISFDNANCNSCYSLSFCDGSRNPVIIQNPSITGPLGINPSSYIGRCFKATVQPPGSPSIDGCFCFGFSDCINPVSGYSVSVDTLFNNCHDKTEPLV